MAYNVDKGREYHLIELDRNGNYRKNNGKYVWVKVDRSRYKLYIENVHALYTKAKTREELEAAFKLTFRLENPEKQWYRDMITGKASRLGMDKATDYEQELMLQEACLECKVLFPPFKLMEGLCQDCKAMRKCCLCPNRFIPTEANPDICPSCLKEFPGYYDPDLDVDDPDQNMKPCACGSTELIFAYEYSCSYCKEGGERDQLERQVALDALDD